MHRRCFFTRDLDVQATAVAEQQDQDNDDEDEPDQVTGAAVTAVIAAAAAKQEYQNENDQKQGHENDLRAVRAKVVLQINVPIEDGIDLTSIPVSQTYVTNQRGDLAACMSIRPLLDRQIQRFDHVAPFLHFAVE
jgi:hypothetical protein